MNTKALYKLSYGLFVLTAREGAKDNGCIINTAIQAASDPDQLSICVNKANYTHDMILRQGVFNVSSIAQDAGFDLFTRFGFQSGREVDKFADFPFCDRSENGLTYVTQGCNAFFSVRVAQKLDLGSHTLFVGPITAMEVLNTVPSATYDYYREHIKPKPTAASGSQTVWRCSICGYEYVGETLPEDNICPICKHSASFFEKVVK